MNVMSKWRTFEKGDAPEEGELYWICFKSNNSVGNTETSYAVAQYDSDDDVWNILFQDFDYIQSKEILAWFPIEEGDDCKCEKPFPYRYYWVQFRTGDDYTYYDSEEEYLDSDAETEIGVYTYDPDDCLWTSFPKDADQYETVPDEDVISSFELPLYTK